MASFTDKFRAFLREKKDSQQLTVLDIAERAFLSRKGVEYVLYTGGCNFETACAIAEALNHHIEFVSNDKVIIELDVHDASMLINQLAREVRKPGKVREIIETVIEQVMRQTDNV